MKIPRITKKLAGKVLATVDAGLVAGVGEPVPGSMCVEAAVCYALGLPHGDDPQCVSSALRSLKIALNDAHWSSAKARAAGLRRLALIQLGSRDTLDDIEFSRRLAEMTIRTVVPAALRAAAKLCAQSSSALLDAASRCEQEGTNYAARAAIDAASYAANYAARAASDAVSAASDAARAASDAARAAIDAARAASDAASYAASDAVSAASYAARAASDAANYAARAASDAVSAASDAASYAASDGLLSSFAEGVVRILVDMGVPGCKWLALTE